MFKFFSYSILVSLLVWNIAPGELLAQVVRPKEEFSVKEYDEEVIKLVELSNSSTSYNQVIETHDELIRKATKDNLTTYIANLRVGNKADTQIALIKAMKKVGDKRALKALRFEFFNAPNIVKREVVSAFAAVGGNYIVPLLYEILNTDSKKIDIGLQVRAANALAEINSQKSIYTLNAILGDRDIKKKHNSSIVKKAVGWAYDKISRVLVGQSDNVFPKGTDQKLSFKGLEYYFYQPPFRPKKVEYIEDTQVSLNSPPWILVCVHSKDYQIKKLFDKCKEEGRKYGIATIAPIFNTASFLNYETFNFDGVRSDLILWELIDFVSRKANLNSKEIYMLGIGEGGDFIHRFAFTRPDRVAKAFFRANDYTAVGKEVYFPQGFKLKGELEDLEFDIDKIVKTDMAVGIIASSKDTKRLDPGWDLLSRVDVYSYSKAMRSRIKKIFYSGSDLKDLIRAADVGLKYLFEDLEPDNLGEKLIVTLEDKK